MVTGPIQKQFPSMPIENVFSVDANGDDYGPRVERIVASSVAQQGRELASVPCLRWFGLFYLNPGFRNMLMIVNMAKRPTCPPIHPSQPQ